MKFLFRKGSVVMTRPRRLFFQKWMRKIYFKFLIRRQYRKNWIDSCSLSAHLMNDLGFDRDGNPTQWSTFFKVSSVSHEADSSRVKKTRVEGN